MDKKYKLVRVISQNDNFLVLEVRDEMTGDTLIDYITCELDLDKEYFTVEDLQLIWW